MPQGTSHIEQELAVLHRDVRRKHAALERTDEEMTLEISKIKTALFGDTIKDQGMRSRLTKVESRQREVRRGLAVLKGYQKRITTIEQGYISLEGINNKQDDEISQLKEINKQLLEDNRVRESEAEKLKIRQQALTVAVAVLVVVVVFMLFRLG